MADKITLDVDQSKAPKVDPARTQSSKQRVNDYGRSLINQLFMLMRTVRVHDINNEAFARPLENFVQTVNTLLAMEGKVVISTIEGQIFLNDYKIKGDKSQQENMQILAEEFTRRDIGGFTINQTVDTTTIKRFLLLFMKHEDIEAGQGVQTMQQALTQAQLQSIMVNKVQSWKDDLQDAKHTMDRRHYAMQTYVKTMLSAKPLLGGSKASVKAADKLKTHRLVQDLVDVAHEDDHSFLGLTTIKNYDEYLYNHSVNVCVLSIALGLRLGLPKSLLAELGMAALFHDMGMVRLPLELVNKTGRFTEEDRRIMERHTRIAAKSMLSQKNLGSASVRRVLVAYEHHMNYNAAGYPRPKRGRKLNLFSRIVQIVDHFDSMTTAKPYREAFLPDETLKIMLKDAGTKYDPVLMKVFVNMLGVYPLGTLIELSTGEKAFVFHNSNDPAKFERPRVKVVMDAAGNKVKPQIVDLSEKSGAGYKRDIVRSLDPTKWDLNVPGYMLS